MPVSATEEGVDDAVEAIRWHAASSSPVAEAVAACAIPETVVHVISTMNSPISNVLFVSATAAVVVPVVVYRRGMNHSAMELVCSLCDQKSMKQRLDQ